MPINVETPPTLSGQAEQQLKQLYSYLYRLSEKLNIALNSLSAADIKGTVTETTGAAGSTQSASNGSTNSEYTELRELITNTASYVHVAERRLQQQLSSSYEAISAEWGTYRESVSSSMETTARDVVNSYGFDSALSTLQEEAAGFSEYKTHTEGFIRQGFVDYDENNVPIIGIAIGQNLTSTEVTVGGETLQRFDPNQSCAFYTADKVSFRINGQEVAYLSNRKLYIGDADITGDFTFGDEWMITHSNGFAIKWVGA